jgi:hypothetical protein
MKIARLVGFVLVAAMALSLAVASAAFAEPEFKPTGGTFTGTSTTSNTLIASGNTVSCTANSTKGTISSATLAGGITVTFTGCKSSKVEGTECAVNSVGAAEGTIVTNTLHGVLGLILPKGSGSGVGLLLLPVTTKKFLTLVSNKCTIESAVNGNVAGEASPIGSSQTTGKLVFQRGTEGESIKSIDLSTGGTVTPELEAFGKEASQGTTESLTYSEAVEVS